MTRLVGERLILRPARRSDIDQLHEVFSHPQAMRYWSTPPHTEISQTADFVDAMMSLPFESGEDFIVEHDGRVIGKAGLWQLPEIGFILHPETWGRGLGREAVMLVIDHGFRARGLSEIIADVDPRNVASMSLLESLGFTETGREVNTILIGDEWCDSVYYALAKPHE